MRAAENASYESVEQEVSVHPGMRLIKFAGSLVEVQHQAFVCGSHQGCGASAPLLCVHPRGNPSPAGVPRGTLFTHSTVWKSVRLQIRCSETNVITLTSTSRFLLSVFLPPQVAMLGSWGRGFVKVRDNAALSDLVPGSCVSSEELKPWRRKVAELSFAVVEIQQQCQVSCAASV